MPRTDYRNCRSCGKSGAEVGALSHTRLCRPCALVLEAENMDGIHFKTGPAFRRWRHAMAASVGGVLVDDLRGGT